MFGYWVIFFLGVYGYVADNTSVESRWVLSDIFLVMANQSFNKLKQDAKNKWADLFTKDTKNNWAD